MKTDVFPERCPYCNKVYLCVGEEQRPGYRIKDYKICPYCRKIIDESMEYEWETEKYEDQND